MDLLTLGILILLLPLASAALAGIFGRPLLKDQTHYLPILGVLGAVICAWLVLTHMRESADVPTAVTAYEWIGSGAAKDGAQAAFTVNFWFDQLTAVMLMTVTFVALLVVVYSKEYMRHDGHAERGYERYFAYLGLFVFSMCTLVLSGNFLLLYLGWEAVGLSSYLLIGFYYEKPSAAAAAKKAFLVNRIGDFGFGLGILLIYLKCQNLDYAYVLSEQGLAQLSGYEGIIALLLFCGAVGKSAQLPLYVWLPDAMEGPSPVSALIHAATMVTAGVYMVARCGAIFVSSADAMFIVAVVGAATALFAATMALAQYDMKRILAYSTISQLGYMFMGLGVYAADAAVFHLFTHAFFKALLFLGAGSVMHAMGGVIDVREFGGLRKLLPWTFWSVLIGSAALAGLPFLSGFYSKDMIIHRALDVHPVFGIIGIVTAALTAFYTFRMVFLAFFGPERVPEGVHAHESGWWIRVPLLILSVGAIGCGYAFHTRLPEFLAPVMSPFAVALDDLGAHGWHVSHGTMALLSGAVAVLSVACAWLMYVLLPELPSTVRTAMGDAYRWVHNKYYVDEALDAVVVKPLWRFGEVLFVIDRLVVDGLVFLVSAVPKVLGFALRGLQGGGLQTYGTTMATGLAILLFVILYSSYAVGSP